MKKIASVVLTLLLLMSLATTAFAAGNTAVISVASGDDRTYAVYQIFVGDLAGNTLSNVTWGQNGTGTAGTAVPEATLEKLVGLANSLDTEKLAEIEKLVNLDGAAFGTVSAAKSLSVPTGYYLIVDKGAVDVGEAYSLNLVKVVGTTVITPKTGEVTSEKKVDDKNDSDTSEDATVWQDSADYDIGDAVPFKLSGTVPADYANYGAYYYCFHDTEAAGLTFNASSVIVKVDGTVISDGYTVVTDCSDGCAFEVVFANLKNVAAVKAGSEISVEYNSTLNENAVVGSAGNENTMHLEYSNNPNSGDGKGVTPDDTVIVFTYKLVINKVDRNQNALKGAGFTLYKKNAAGNWNAVGEEIYGTELTTFAWNGIDDGVYKLVETKTPDGYNTMADIEFTVTASHAVNWTKGNGSALTELKSGSLGDGKVDTGVIEKNVVNNKGTVLPETGSTGTMIFVIVGSVTVMVAAIFMITRKKMSVYKD